jgi:ribosomal protein L40E
MSFTDRVRNVDRRAIVAYVLAAAALVIELRSTTTGGEDGVVVSCTSKDWADVLLGLAAIGLALVVMATAEPRNAAKSRIVAGAAAVAGLGVLPTGFGWIGGPCEENGYLSTIVVGLAGLVVVAAIASSATASEAALAAVAPDGPPGPDLSAGLQRCRSCAFSSNPLDASVCRMCGSTDLQAVVPRKVGGPPRP